MTRHEIEQSYKIENGRIRSPGAFEGEMIYVPYFWQIFLEGGADEDDGHELRFDITEIDREAFPELGDREVISLYQRDDGFVCEV